MRNFFATLIFLCTCCIFSLSAQTPQAFNYQGVARDVYGNPVSNRTISLLFSITHQTADDVWSTAYQETHSLTTSNFGLFSTQIGTGTTLSINTFDAIDWGAEGRYYLEISIDMDGGSDYTPMGAPAQLVSVPYALHAATCDELSGGLHWGDYPGAPGAISNTNENTVIVSPDNCCIAYTPETLNAALVVHGDDRPTGAYFTTNNLSLDASAIKAEINGFGLHSDPVAVRGSSIVFDANLGNGGVGGEFIGGESGVVCQGDYAGIVARSPLGKAGRFEGDVDMTQNLSVHGSTQTNKLQLIPFTSGTASLSFEMGGFDNQQSFTLKPDFTYSTLLEFGHQTSTLAEGVKYKSLFTVNTIGQVAIGRQQAGLYSMLLQQNGAYGLGITSNGNAANTWELYIPTVGAGQKPNLSLYSGNGFMGQFNVNTGAYTQFSDRKFKKDIRPMTPVSQEVKKLNLVTYQTEQDASGARHSGVIAQELETVFPEYVMVSQDREGQEVRSVDYAGLSIVALKALQEQQERLEKLEKTNAELLLRLQQLENRK